MFVKKDKQICYKYAILKFFKINIIKHKLVSKFLKKIHVYLLFIVINPPISGANLKYLLQKSSDVNSTENTEPIITPITWPVALHVDA